VVVKNMCHLLPMVNGLLLVLSSERVREAMPALSGGGRKDEVCG